jgi:CRP/FNR family transcriptional regulator, cyclic AMP receptor protein
VLFTTVPDPVRRLRDLDVFAGCTGRELRQIDRRATTTTVRAGRILCHQGDIGRECFVIIDGEVDIAIDDRHVSVGGGALVGEIALLTPGGRRTATVTAKTGATLLVFTRTEFRHVMAAFPTIAHRIVRESTRRLVEDIDI